MANQSWMLIGSALTILCTSLVTACARADDVQVVIQPVVQSSTLDGVPNGCDISFHIARGTDAENWQSAIGVTISLIVVSETDWGAVMKIGYQPGSATVVPPNTAFLHSGTSNNENEITDVSTPNEYGYILITYIAGPATYSAFNGLVGEGEIGITFRMADGRDRVWSADFKDQPEILRAWNSCTQSFPALRQNAPLFTVDEVRRAGYGQRPLK